MRTITHTNRMQSIKTIALFIPEPYGFEIEENGVSTVKKKNRERKERKMKEKNQ